MRFIAVVILALIGSVPIMADTPIPRVEEVIVGLHAAAADDIAAAVARAVGELATDSQRASSRWRLARAARLDAQIRAVLARLGAASGPAMDAAARSAATRALRETAAEITALGLNPNAVYLGGRFDEAQAEVVARDTVAALAAGASGELAEAAAGFGRDGGRLFRALAESAITAPGRGEGEAAVNRAIARGLISGDPRITDRAVRELFRDPGSPAAESYRRLGARLVNVGRAVMSVRQYAAVVTRTRMREAQVEARHGRLRASGFDLVQITGRVSVNFCTRFIGLVCSLGAARTIDGVEYPALAGLPGGGPPFHPQCSKGTALYVPDLVGDRRVESSRSAFERFDRARASGRLTEPVGESGR